MDIAEKLALCPPFIWEQQVNFKVFIQLLLVLNNQE